MCFRFCHSVCEYNLFFSNTVLLFCLFVGYISGIVSFMSLVYVQLINYYFLIHALFMKDMLIFGHLLQSIIHYLLWMKKNLYLRMLKKI